MAKSSNPVEKARKLDKKKQKAKNAKARKDARTAPKKAEAASAAGSGNIIQILPGQKGGGIKMPKEYKGKNPRRSVYYDAVFNPTGAPPPGFEWKERSVSPEEDDEDDDAESDEEDSDDSDEIALPEGPAPSGSRTAANDEEEDSDDDIPMPEGPPPPQANTSAAGSMSSRPAHFPPSFAPPPSGLPPPPQHFRPSLPIHPHDLPAAQPYQAYQAYSAPMPAPQAARPPPPSRAQVEAARKSATITAEPELRDLRKEATTAAFVPNAVKRKRN